MLYFHLLFHNNAKDVFKAKGTFTEEGERKFELPLLNTSVFAASFHSPCQSPKEACLQTSKERKGTANLAPKDFSPTESLPWLLLV